jgi:hypothetical protein
VLPIVELPLRVALVAIHAVHGDGSLPPIDAFRDNAVHREGIYYRYGGEFHAIAVSMNANEPVLTMTHEGGHFLDEYGLGRSGILASLHDPRLATRRRVARAAGAV